jgi:hypothetical protein
VKESCDSKMSVTILGSDFDDKASEPIEHLKKHPDTSKKRQRTITITQGIAASSSRYANLASGVHQTYTRVE